MFFRNYGLLWQNARNLQYIKWWNFTIDKKIADSKLKTKEFLKNKNIPVPETLYIIEKNEDIKENILETLEPPFVIKPNNWYGWKWIVIFEKKDSLWNLVSSNWKTYTKKKLLNYFSYILDWFFSLSWKRDKVLIEKKIILSNEIELLWKFGLPDIRVIVYNMVPVMAMLRVPTKESSWKANLHAGACWVWIDIGTWKLTFITKKSKIIKSIPWIWDVRWIKLPDWKKILELAVNVQKTTGIKYLWCDVVLDEKMWPLLLEMNIRAWLEVQVSNLAPLKSRLDRVEGIRVNSVEKGVRLWRDLFSWDIEEKIKNITWKKVLWIKEYMTIKLNEKKYKYLVNIRVSQNSSFIDKNFLKDILKIDIKSLIKIKLNCEILWKTKNIGFLVKELDGINIILWLASLKGFLIDPYKYKKWEIPVSSDIKIFTWKNDAITKNYEKQLLNIDNSLMKIDSRLLLLKFTTPNNLEEEKTKFILSKWEYIPKFKYNEIKFSINELEQKINNIEIPEIPLNWIYRRKKEEILNKLQFLRAFKKQDTEWMNIFSEKIFWKMNIENLKYSNNILQYKKEIKQEEEYIWFEEIKDYVKKFNHIYSIKILLQKRNITARFSMRWESMIFRDNAKVWKKEMRSIIAHEIEWHYLRKYNWKKLKFSIFSKGTAWYLWTEEWIAIYSQNRFLTKKDNKYYGIFETYYFINFALKHSYKKLIKKLLEYYDNDYNKVFLYTLRLKRWFEDITKWWCFMKDIVYVNWYLKIKNYLNSWRDLKELYLWKIWIEDFDEIRDTYILNYNLSNLKIPFFL